MDEVEFKDTIMGKMTMGAIINWGENDENNEWFQPTPEQAKAIVSEGGLQLGDKVIDYSSADKATNQKTYGSELAAIDGIVKLVGDTEGLSDEQRRELAEQLKEESYTKASLSDELSNRIKTAMGQRGVETSIVEILCTIHDNWVKGNSNNFDAPGREKKLYQFTDLRLMTYKADGAIADLLFLQPILEGAGVEVDVEGKLKEEFENQQLEYMREKGITSREGLQNYLRNLDTTYETVRGVTTTRKGTSEPKEISTILREEPEVLDRMTGQVYDNFYVKPEILGEMNERATLKEQTQIQERSTQEQRGE